MISLFSKDYKKHELRALLELVEDFQCVSLTLTTPAMSVSCATFAAT